MKSLLAILIWFSFVSLRCWAAEDDNLNFILIPAESDNNCFVKIQQSVDDLIRSFLEEIDYHSVEQLQDYNFYYDIYEKQCNNQFIIQKHHFHLKKLKKLLKSCLNPNQFKVLEKAEKAALRFYFIICKADQEQVKITIMKLMKLCLHLREECLKIQSSSLLNCLKMILYSDLNDNLNNRRMEYSPLFRRSSVIPLETTIIQEVTPSTTSNSNVAITKSMDKSNTMETTTNVPENKPSSTSTTSTLLLVASSGIATSLLAYGAFKMKARLLQLLTT